MGFSDHLFQRGHTIEFAVCPNLLAQEYSFVREALAAGRDIDRRLHGISESLALGSDNLEFFLNNAILGSM
jgi:hypothetical protein